MIKYVFFIAVCVSLTLSACGSGSTTTEVSDSTAVSSDSLAVQSENSGAAATDSTAVK